jgi:hypothetical protein
MCFETEPVAETRFVSFHASRCRVRGDLAAGAVPDGEVVAIPRRGPLNPRRRAASPCSSDSAVAIAKAQGCGPSGARHM